MEPWENALEKFLKPWKARREVVGAIVCGSYVTGNPSKRSDIDVQIVLREGTPWRERGNKIIDGFLIEYFANPPLQLRKYFEDDWEKNARTAPTMFVTGNVIFAKDDSVERLRKEATRYLKRPFKRPSRTMRELSAYGLWDALDNLEDASENRSPSFRYAYHMMLALAFETYAKHLGSTTVQPHKIIEMLTDGDVRKKYRNPGFPDERFVRMFVKAAQATDDASMRRHAKAIVSYVLKRMGWREIDGWRLRSPIEKNNT